MKDFHCPLHPSNVASYLSRSTAHCSLEIWQCAEGGPLHIAPQQCDNVLNEIHSPVLPSIVALCLRNPAAHCSVQKSKSMQQKQRSTSGAPTQCTNACSGTASRMQCGPHVCNTWATLSATTPGRTVRGQYINVIKADLARHWTLPMDSWERTKLINVVLLPKWLHCVILMPPNKYSHNIDAPCSHSVCEPTRSEPPCLARCVSTPPKQGGLGLHQIFWVYRQRFVTSFPHLLRTHNDRLPVPLSSPPISL